MHDGMLYGRNQGQGQGHSRKVDRQSPTGLIFIFLKHQWLFDTNANHLELHAVLVYQYCDVEFVLYFVSATAAVLSSHCISLLSTS